MKKLLGILSLLIVLLLAGFTVPTGTAIQFDNVKAGPYVDNVVYKIITNADQRVLALQSDEVELIADTIHPAVVDVLESDPDIEVANHTRNGYGKFVINCDKFPLNITAFRRAFAFALNKTNVSLTLFGEYANPIDSPLPEVNPWSIEGDLPYSYYDQNIIIANQTLGDAGFANIDGDGWREAPDGSDFSVDIEVSSSSTLSIDIGNMAASALQAVGVDATCVPTDFNDYLTRVNLHGDFDVVFYAQNFADYDPRWMVHEFGSDFYDVDYFNPSNWQNSTFDAWVDQLLNDTTYAGVLEAVTKMQEIIVHSSPEIMIYSNMYFTSYRSDQFEGQVNDDATGVYSTWTNIKTHLLPGEGGPFGGLFDIALPFDMDSFNFMVSNSVATMTVLDNLYMSLFKTGPAGELVPYLAESLTIETHADNSSIPENHTRFTIDIIQNATWSDWTPVSAMDVAYSFRYYRDSVAYGNPTGIDLTGLVSAENTSMYTLVLEFDTESYWHFDSFAFDYIIPTHIFVGIGESGWSSWNPVLSTDPHVTCGPFILSDYVTGEFVELTTNPFYPYYIHVVEPPTISGPDDFSAVEGSLVEITWTASDDNPVVYFILENGTQMVGDFWYGADITYSFYAPMPGNVLNITAIVWDGDALYAIDTVFVTGLVDSFPPDITLEPDDLEYSYGETGNSLYWEYSDSNLAAVDLYQDGVMAFSDPIGDHPTNFTWDVDGLSIGVYNFTLYLDDIWMNIATSTVYVTVVDPESLPPVITLEPDDLEYNYGETGNILYWEYFDYNIATVELYLDDTLIYSDLMGDNPTNLTWNVDGHGVGEYNYTLYIDDTWFQSTTSTVIVTVITADAPPEITHPTLLVLLEGESSNNVTWVATDTNPNTYSVFQNGTEIDSGTWASGTPIIVDLSGLEIGIYNLTIVVTDVAGNMISDTVLVVVLPLTLVNPIPFETVIIISIGVLLAGVVVIVIIVKLKR